MNRHQDNEAAFRAVIDAFARNDLEAAADLFDEDAVVVDFSDPTHIHSGRAAAKALMASFREHIPDIEIEVTSTVALGDRLAAELVARGTPRGEPGPIELYYGIFDVFRDGRIVSEHIYAVANQAPIGP